MINQNMREVTKDEFYSTVGQMNVHPNSERHVTYWKTPVGRLMGQSTPGYMAEGPEKYYVAENCAA